MAEKLLVIMVIVALILGGGGYYAGSMTGYEEGAATGYATGYINGTVHGYTTGHTKGTEEGYADGYSQGEIDGLAELKTKVSESYVQGRALGVTEGYMSGYDEGYNEGYDLGFTEGFATTGYTLRDPNYDELTTFLKYDKTNKIEYNETFDCENFASTLKTNAFAKGYHCFTVYIEFTESAHTLNAFNTTDMGFLYIEPQTDDIVTVKLNKAYWDRSKFIVDYDDVIREIVISP